MAVFESSATPDISTPLGTIVFHLYEEATPLTCLNFRNLCMHHTQYGYKNTPFHRIFPGFLFQGGDVTNYNGKGGQSSEGGTITGKNTVHFRK